MKNEELDAMMKEASGPINFTVFLTMFGEKLKGKPNVMGPGCQLPLPQLSTLGHPRLLCSLTSPPPRC